EEGTMMLRTGRRMGWGRMAVIAALVAAMVCARTQRLAVADDGDEHQYATEFGLGVGALVIDFVYMPVKFVYATLGGLTGGFAYVLTIGRFDTAAAIWRPAIGGTYVITPAMLRGDEEIHFSGSTERSEDRRYERSSSDEPTREHAHPPGE